MRRKSLIPEKNTAGAEDTIMFDAAQEIKQFGHLMVMNVAEAQGLAHGHPEYSNMDQSSEQVRLGAAVRRQAMMGEKN